MKQHTTTAAEKDIRDRAIRDRARVSLENSLGAVQAAISAMPNNVVPAPRNLTEVFLLIDPVLSMLNKQLLEARAQSAQLVQAFGMGDAMSEALALQIAALEKAYNERLALLHKKREEAGKGAKRFTKTAEAGMPADVRRRMLSEDRRKSDALWLLALLFLTRRQAFARQYGLVPNAA